MKAHCTWAFANGFTEFSLSPCACFKTHTAPSSLQRQAVGSFLHPQSSLCPTGCTQLFIPPRFQAFSWCYLYDGLPCQLDGTKNYQPPRASLSLGKTAHFSGAICNTCEPLRYFRNQSALMRALKSLWTNFELLYTCCSSQVGIKRCSLLQCIVWWRAH